MRVLLVDNYDSFTHNVAHLFGMLGARVAIVRNDDSSLNKEAVAAADALCLGPGPGRPAGAGKTLEALGWAIAGGSPVLGVCLGHQAIGEYFGGAVTHAPRLVHGKATPIEHDDAGLFEGVSKRFEATRYHSLCVATAGFPAALRVCATSDDGVIQGLAHRALPIWGVQFHPESVLTVEGDRIFANFLLMARR